MSIDVVIVNWNSGLLLGECIKSLESHGNDHIKKIIVIDNASKDKSLEYIRDHENLISVRNKNNLGFSKACNIGANYSSAEFILFLNPDAMVFSGTLNDSMAFLRNQANAKIGICGVQLKDESGRVARSCSRFPSSIGFLAHAMGLNRLFSSLGHAMSEWNHDTTREVDQVIGAFFLVRRSLFESLAGFDERFFVYFEEVDFSYRAKQAGWKSIYFAEAQAFHAGGGTSNQIKARRLFYSLRSRLLYANKHFTLLGSALVFFATLIVEPISRSVLATVRRSWPSLKETWQGYAMLWRWLPQWVFKGVTR